MKSQTRSYRYLLKSIQVTESPPRWGTSKTLDYGLSLGRFRSDDLPKKYTGIHIWVRMENHTDA